MKTYPVNLVLENKLVILIGGKGEIVRKIPGLLEVGAKVRFIAPEVDEVVRENAAQGLIEWLPRRYQPGDLQGAFVVFACTNDQSVHDQIWAEGQANGQLVNVMDVIPQCDFHAASLVRRGQLTISIGTGGAAPVLAVRLRKRFEREFGPEYATFLDYAQTLRPIVAQRVPFKHRAAFWHALLDHQALEFIRADKMMLLEATVKKLLAHYGDSTATQTEKPTQKTEALRLLELPNP